MHTRTTEVVKSILGHRYKPGALKNPALETAVQVYAIYHALGLKFIYIAAEVATRQYLTDGAFFQACALAGVPDAAIIRGCYDADWPPRRIIDMGRGQEIPEPDRRLFQLVHETLGGIEALTFRFMTEAGLELGAILRTGQAAGIALARYGLGEHAEKLLIDLGFAQRRPDGGIRITESGLDLR